MTVRRRDALTVHVEMRDTPTRLRKGLKALAEEYPISFEPVRGAIVVRWIPRKGMRGYVLARYARLELSAESPSLHRTTSFRQAV